LALQQVLSGPGSQQEQQQQQQQQSLSRLAPSVYSHPSVTDPLLKSPPQSFYQDPAVLLPRKGFSVSSSGAYFDTSAMAAGNLSASGRDASDLQVVVLKKKMIRCSQIFKFHLKIVTRSKEEKAYRNNLFLQLLTNFDVINNLFLQFFTKFDVIFYFIFMFTRYC
jgi:hypothetical protein